MASDSGDRVLELATQRIRDVADPRRTVRQPLKLCRWYAGRSDNRDPAEARPVELAGRVHLEIGETLAVFPCHMSDGNRKAGCHRAQQHLGRPGPGVVSAFIHGLVHHQLELPDADLTPVAAIQAGGNLSHG